MTSGSLLSLPAWQKANILQPDNFRFPGFCPPRCAHTALCINEDLLVWGGYNDENIATIYCQSHLLWVFNVDLDCWFCILTDGTSPDSRTGSASALVWPKWYIVGGHVFEGDSPETFALNLLTLQWELFECEPFAKLGRDKSTAWTWKERIYIFGGYGLWRDCDIWEKGEDHFVVDLVKGWNDQLLCLDVEAKEWIRPAYEGRKPSARAAHTAVLVEDIVYIFGGRHCKDRLNDLHCMDMNTHTWSGKLTCFGEQPCGRSWHAMCSLGKSELFLFGGYSSDDVPLADSWLLNTATLSWSQLKKDIGHPRLWHTACLNSQGDVLVYGGCASNILDDDVRMETSSKVILFKRKPFKLVRLCLHTIYKHEEETESQWGLLPNLFREWLKARKDTKSYLRARSYLPNLIIGHGPSISNLSTRCV